ncbi:MAG: hypothetical protein R6V19_09300 [Armatimonadota bacterium]
MIKTPFTTIALTVCALAMSATAFALLVTPEGLWSSSLYRVNISVSGRDVSGSFALLDDPDAPPGQIEGELRDDGTFLATWTVTERNETGSFQTLLDFSYRDGLMTGYRWTDETMPTQFSLRRAVDGKLVQPLTEDDVDESILDSAPDIPESNTPTDTPSTTAPERPTVPQVPATPANLKVIVCESVDDGQPVNVGTEFIGPKSVTALLRYKNLPQNSTVQWLWTMDGRTEATTTKTLGGNGWYMHGLRFDTVVNDGIYQLTVTVNGKVAAQRTVTVHPGSKRGPAPAPKPAASSGLDIDVIMCERAEDGEPVNPGTQFTSPKSLACLAKYRNLPANTELKWIWQLPNGQTKQSVRTVQNSGWAWHGLNAEPAMSPGTYTVTLSARGQVVKTVRITVR